ncbi:MAG: stage II sporulation protein M [Pseudomonadota bacterium]
MTDLLKSYKFREEREADWRKLDRILAHAERSGVKSLTDQDMLALPRLYRQAVSSLSVARSISLDQNVIIYLENLCTRSYFFVYGTRTTLGERLAQFFRHDWPTAVRSAWRPTLLSAVCLFGGALAAFVLCMIDMEWFWSLQASGLAGDRNPNATTEYLQSTLYSDTTDADGLLSAFSAQLFSNNSGVALFAFALGFMFGVPTALLIAYNGVILGAFYALFWSRGLGFEVTGWLLIHGVTELFGIVLAGAAGFMIGGAVAFPGDKDRLASARDRGQSAAMVAVGVVVMMFIAAILEGFGRQLINSDLIRYAIAGTSAVLWGTYFYLPKQRHVIDD